MSETKRKLTNKQKAAEIYQLFQSFKSKYRYKWHGTHQEAYDFVLNDQQSAELKKDLKDSGMPDFVINMLLPAVELMRYFLTANNPRWQAIGREGSDTDFASVVAAMGEYIYQKSSGKSVLGQNVLNIITKSKCYWHVVIDPDGDHGLGEVKIEYVDPFDVYESPDSSDIYGRDAGAKIIHKVKTRKSLIDKLPQYSAKIKKASSFADFEYYSSRDLNDTGTIQPEDIIEGYNDDGSLSEQLDYFEKYKKVKVPYVNVVLSVPPSEQEIAEFNKLVDVQIKELTLELETELKEYEVQLNEALNSGEMIQERATLEMQKAQKAAEEKIEQRRQYFYSQAHNEATKVEQKNITKEEFNILQSDKDAAKFIVSSSNYFETRIERSCVVGDQLLYQYILPDPIDEYPLFSIPAIYTGTPYPMAFVVPAIGKQKEINRAHQITIHNANLGSNVRYMVQSGQVDKEQWEKYSSSAGAILEWFNLGDGTKPELILPMPLNNAFYTLTEKGQQDIEYLIGMMGSAMGLVQTQPETYKGMLANDEFSTRRLRGWTVNVFEPGMELLGNILHQFARATYTINKVFRVVQPHADTGEIQSVSEEINIPMYNDLGEEIGRYKDLQASEYDVVFVGGSTMPLNRWALLEEYFRWFQAGIIDDIEFVQHTDIRDKEGLLKRKSIYSDLKSQVDQLSNSIKNKDGDIETLSRQVLQLSIKAKESGMINEMRKDVLETESKQKILQGQFKNEIDAQKRKIKETAESTIKKIDKKEK